MREVDAYYKLIANPKDNITPRPPPKLIRAILCEKFNKLPDEIGKVWYKDVQELFAIYKQRESSMKANYTPK